MRTPSGTPVSEDLLLRVRGTVQGVGFRPFVHRLALSELLSGWVLNDAEGVLIRVQGEQEHVERFLVRLAAEAPEAARLEAVERLEPGPGVFPAGAGFVIRESTLDELSISTAVPADLALCGLCRQELLTPGNRREDYAFVNCTQCGPRYSIVESLPYDRPRTTMRAFRLCPACAREYADPEDRRFHAEPNACPVCGPQLAFLGPRGEKLVEGKNALAQAAKALRGGGIVAVKGIGGFHLFCDATNARVVAELRQRKRRDEKPFAVMVSTLEAAQREASVSEAAEQALRSPQAPIVLVPKSTGGTIAPAVAPGNPWLGLLLPYSPLHVLLLRETGLPLVATSANLSEEPLCLDEGEAVLRLAGIADYFLSHNRPIAHPVDDSVLRLDGRSQPVLLRRSRGYAPSSLLLPGLLPFSVLCTGAQMKATVALAKEDRVVLSPHIGDLENRATQEAFEKAAATLSQLAGSHFDRVACDKHPGYASTEYARRTGLPLFPVQHHLAHLLACLLENRRDPDEVLGVVWDGTGYGEDGGIWGCEFLLASAGRVSRFAHLRPFSLLGGDAAVRDARRAAFAFLREASPSEAAGKARSFGLSEAEAATLSTMMERGINSVRCTSLGRLFDAAGVLLGLGGKNSYEAQLPLAVEALANEAEPECLSQTPLFPLSQTGPSLVADWVPALELLGHSELSPANRALSFHQGLAGLAVDIARRSGVRTVALCGGCFQNILLLDLCRDALQRDGFDVLQARVLPPGDGAIAAGQAYGALLRLGTVEPF